MARRSLRAVLFDVDDTLYSTTEFVRGARENAVRAMIAAGLHLSFERALAELDEVVREFPSNFDRHFDTLILRLPAGACGPVNPAVVVAAGVVAYHQTKQRELAPFPDAVEAIRRLAAGGKLVLGVITSGVPVKQAEKLVRLGVLEHIDPRAVFFPEQMGFSKHNPKVYTQACRALDLEPAACMCVGDHPVRDVDSPKSAGLIAALLRRGDGKYSGLEGGTPPDYRLSNFWDLLEVIERDFDIG